MAETTYTVVRGDTLWAIAQKYNTTVDALVALNNIKDPDFIVVGQVLKITGTAETVKKNTTSRATITVFGLQSDTDRTVYATWTWDKSYTENYQVKWYYDTGDGVWFVGNDSTVTDKQSTYTAPTNAKRVKFKVKPISKKRTVNNKDTSYWTASWSTEKVYSFSSNPPTTPSVPTLTIEEYRLTATLDNLDVNATTIQFQIVKNDASVFNTGKANIITSSASYSCTVTAGHRYKVRCRAIRGHLYSDWSDYSSNIQTVPAKPIGITTCKANSETSVYLEWSSVATATSYDIEYTTDKKYFDGSDQTTIINGVEYTHYEKTGLTSGEEYFFRVRSVNDKGHSDWSDIKSTIIGTTPIAPTTWSSTTTAITGESVNLYWIHNCEDGSSQTYGELELYIDDVKETHTIANSTEEDEKDKTSVYTLNTSSYREGVKIQWRVRTAGITKEYGDWSIQRTIDIYAQPSLEFSMTDTDGNQIETLESFPFYISALAGPNTQQPVGYHLTIVSNDIYETVDNVGNVKIVNAGDQVYSKHFDVNDSLLIELSASDLDLENNIQYTITCSVYMNSGLNTESSIDFTVAWTDIEYEPNAEIGIDIDTYAASIRPHCEDENGEPIADVLLSVYRREYDGGFTEIASNIDNTSNTFVTDPHPALDYARYRVVAKSKTTGAVSYSDITEYPVGGNAVIIQWDEAWTNFSTTNEDELEQPAWAGSLLKLPYNVDISDNNRQDVSLIEYIGRKHPVSYHGTQLGTTSVWSVEIDASDVETLYAIRRLSVWTGNVYVREPSGSGYWAVVEVSYNKKHCGTTIPITLNVTRVEGGM